MGFFDSVLPGDKSGAVGGQTSSAIATPVAAMPAPVASNDSDFLIIDESVSVANVPDTVAPVAEISEPAEELVILDEPTVETADSILIMDETVSEPTVEPISEAVETEETESSGISSVLDFSAMASLVSAPETVAETPVETVETPAVESASAVSFLSLELPSEAAVIESAQVTSQDPDAILSATVTQLKGVVSAKETARDTAMGENEAILAELAADEEAFKVRKAELKKRAAEAQERAREIDASADRARSLITNLELQLQAAA